MEDPRVVDVEQYHGQLRSELEMIANGPVLAGPRIVEHINSLIALIGLHQPNEFDLCLGCDRLWPCATVVAITGELETTEDEVPPRPLPVPTASRTGPGEVRGTAPAGRPAGGQPQAPDRMPTPPPPVDTGAIPHFDTGSMPRPGTGAMPAPAPAAARDGSPAPGGPGGPARRPVFGDPLAGIRRPGAGEAQPAQPQPQPQPAQPQAHPGAPQPGQPRLQPPGQPAPGRPPMGVPEPERRSGPSLFQPAAAQFTDGGLGQQHSMPPHGSDVARDPRERQAPGGPPPAPFPRPAAASYDRPAAGPPAGPMGQPVPPGQLPEPARPVQSGQPPWVGPPVPAGPPTHAGQPTYTGQPGQPGRDGYPDRNSYPDRNGQPFARPAAAAGAGRPSGPVPTRPNPAGPTADGQIPTGQIHTGQVHTGQVPTGRFAPGQVPTGPVPNGHFSNGQVPNGQAFTGPVPTGQIPRGPVPAGQAPTGQFPTGQVHTGQIPTGPDARGPEHRQPPAAMPPAPARPGTPEPQRPPAAARNPRAAAGGGDRVSVPTSRPAPPISGPVEMTAASIAAARAAEMARAAAAAAAAGPQALRPPDNVRGADRGARPPGGRLAPERGRHAGPEQPRPQGSPWSSQATEQRRPISVDDSWAGTGRDPAPRLGPGGPGGAGQPGASLGPDVAGPTVGGGGPPVPRTGPATAGPGGQGGAQPTNAELEAVARAWLARKDSVLDGIDVI
ncbi:hypothetical protein CcI49_26190 [Frankia sp. CcI49]|uniref:hypothetical protein n=1 Tax=Frankia sp. CcI49 TaxID=1745382 RepID=UPI000975C0F1|nr:hypothetical protein [Frankia sp. CcI49]ONH56939.1 hypothetical protein CcI49_26190 [Frankia sp. CcI49]